ncbi:YciI family protein [Neolewinella persica]|uniref:hypothetical protein n=1 Tax=Neolewinella persica TaxID=70998 RepID=UPI00036FEEC9|nr:hypothetical protein [Neolewinella persica]
MKKFIALYYNSGGQQAAPPTMTEAEQAAMLAPWKVWNAKYGDQIVDLGAPLTPASASHDGDSWSGSANTVSGFSIVRADSLEAAREMFVGHPIYNYPGQSIEISEFGPM